MQTKKPIQSITNEEFVEAYVDMKVSYQKANKPYPKFQEVLQECLRAGVMKLTRVLELEKINPDGR